MAKYLNRSYWEKRAEQKAVSGILRNSPSPSAPAAEFAPSEINGCLDEGYSHGGPKVSKAVNPVVNGEMQRTGYRLLASVRPFKAALRITGNGTYVTALFFCRPRELMQPSNSFSTYKRQLRALSTESGAPSPVVGL